MADSTVVCWNCNEVVAADRSECPLCKAGLGPEGRGWGTTEEQFCVEQVILKNRLGNASTFEKVFVGVVILFLTVGGGLLLGLLLALVISRCESWECMWWGRIGAVVGAVIGLALGVTILIGKYSGRARQPISADSVKVEDAVAVEVHPAQPATVSDVVQALVLLAMLVAFAMLAWLAST